MMDLKEIIELIPQRYPFLMIDRVLKIEEGVAYGTKNVSANEPYFQGHFPGEPVMPGVLIIEAIAQLGAVVLMNREENKGKLPLLVGVDKFRFKRKVIPGDVLFLTINLLGQKRGIGRAFASAHVVGDDFDKGEYKKQKTDLAASGIITYALK